MRAHAGHIDAGRAVDADRKETQYRYQRVSVEYAVDFPLYTRCVERPHAALAFAENLRMERRSRRGVGEHCKIKHLKAP